MKRRLNRAYETMTMPDDCAQRIERTLRQAQDAKKQGRYLKKTAPAPARRSFRPLAAAACLVLVMAAGGTILANTLRQHSDAAVTPVQGEQTSVPAPSDETAVPPAQREETTPADFYRVAADLPAHAVETFAQSVREAILAGDWKSLAQKTQFPALVSGKQVQSQEALIRLFQETPCSEDFLTAIRGESCRSMFCNWQGICLGDGQVWIGQTEDGLKVITINLAFQDNNSMDSRQKEEALNRFRDILQNEGTFLTAEKQPYDIQGYCEAYGAAEKMTVTVSQFTLADMDGDGIPELILQLAGEDGAEQATLVLRYGSDTLVHGFSFAADAMSGIGKGGGYMPKASQISLVTWARLFFPDDSTWESRRTQQAETVPAQWHCYPCRRVDLVLSSYETAANEQGSSLGGAYFWFRDLIRGKRPNNWEIIRQALGSLQAVEQENSVMIFDPAAPGRVLLGNLGEKDGSRAFESLEYYVCNETGEYQAEALYLLYDYPQFQMLLNADGEKKILSSAEALLEEMTQAVTGTEGNRDADQVIAVARDFTLAFFEGDTARMRTHLSKDFRDQVYSSGKPGQTAIVAYRGVPEEGAEAGQTASVSVTVAEPGEDAYSYMVLDMVKQADGWKITFFGLDK